MVVAIFGSRRQDSNREALATFFDELGRCGIDVVLHRNFYNTLMQLIPASLACVCRIVDGPDFNADIVISFGGDGTFLRTAMWVGDKEIPILGVNTGHLGYLTTATIEDLVYMVPEILGGNYVVERRSLLQVVEPSLTTWPYALNEVVVAKYETSSVITAETRINGMPLASYRADGLIVSTPTGSTAYNLSVGGPVIQPSAPVWVLSPISAHSLSMRPLVVSDTNEIAITVSSRAAGYRLTLDGRSGTLAVGTTIVLRKAVFSVLVICRPGYEFPNALRNKLSWGVDGI